MKALLMAFFALLLLSATIAFGQATPATPAPMNLVQMIMYYADMVAQLMFGLMLVATVVTRLIPGKKDDEALGKVWGKVHKVLGYLPTLGINPRTKKLQEALDRMKSSDKK